MAGAKIRQLWTLPPVDARCILMGLIVVLQGHEEALSGGAQWNQGARFSSEARVRFRQQLLREPKAQVVRRREAARRQRAFHLETIHYYWPPTDPRQAEDVERKIRELRGYE